MDTFRNKSGKPQPIRTKVGTHTEVKGRQRSRNLGRGRLSGGDMGAKKCLGRVSFFCRQYQTTFQQLRNGRFSPNLATTRESWVKRRIRTEIYENFHSGVICPQNLKLWGGQTGTLLRAGYRSRDTLQRYCLFHVVVQEPGSFRYLVNFSVRRMVAELRGFKVAQFSDFGLFSPYRTPKTYLPVTSLQHRGYIAEWFRFFRVVDEGPKGCFPAAEFSCDFW